MDYAPIFAALSGHVVTTVAGLLAVAAAVALVRVAVMGVRRVLFIIEFRKSEHYADWVESRRRD